MEKDTTTSVGLDDSKRKLVVAIWRPGERELEPREMLKEPHLIQRVFRRCSPVEGGLVVLGRMV